MSGQRDADTADRWIAQCRRILAEGRARRAGEHVRSAPRDLPAAAPDRRDDGREDLRPDVTPPTETWTPSSVLDDIPPGPEPDEEDWRR